MTVTTRKIESELNVQAEEYAKGVIDVSEKLIKKGVVSSSGQRKGCI